MFQPEGLRQSFAFKMNLPTCTFTSSSKNFPEFPGIIYRNCCWE